MAGPGLAQVRPVGSGAARENRAQQVADSLLSPVRSRYDSLRQTMVAAGDSLRKDLGMAAAVLEVPDVAGWMPAFPELNIDPAILLKKAGFSGMPADLGDFGRLTGIAENRNPRSALAATGFTGGPNQITDHFASKQEALSQAMEELDRYKNKYRALEGLPSGKLRFVNTMRGRPWPERMVPGIRFRMIRRNPPAAEFTPMMAYRVTGKLSVGFGWTSRLKLTGSAVEQIACGPMVSVDAEAGKGFKIGRAHV